VPQTDILPPLRAVYLAWAYTGKATGNDASMKIATAFPERELTELQDNARDPKLSLEERKYVSGALSVIQGAIRTLEETYKGRKLNQTENQKLRGVYVAKITDNKDFGLKLSDLLKSLPGLTIGPAASIPFLTFFQASTKQPLPVLWWIIPALLSVIGFLITIGMARLNSRQLAKEYVRMDYESTKYYFDYLRRANKILKSLYDMIQAIHVQVFSQSYPLPERNTRDNIIDTLTNDPLPTHCQHIENHFNHKKIKPEFWPHCETGDWHGCPLWGKTFPNK
jgi:hypothetical protein